MLLMETEKGQHPAGFYECPQCKSGLEVFVPMTALPTHQCGVSGRKVYDMVYKGRKRVNSTRSSIGRLDSPKED